MLAFHWYTQHIKCSVPKPYLPAKWHRKKGEAWSAKPASRGRGNRAARDGERQTTAGRDTRPSGQAPHAPAHRYGRAPGRPKATPRGYCWKETKAEAALGSSPVAADQGADPKHRAQSNCPLTCPPHSHCHRQHLTSGEQLFFPLPPVGSQLKRVIDSDWLFPTPVRSLFHSQPGLSREAVRSGVRVAARCCGRCRVSLGNGAPLRLRVARRGSQQGSQQGSCCCGRDGSGRPGSCRRQAPCETYSCITWCLVFGVPAG